MTAVLTIGCLHTTLGSSSNLKEKTNSGAGGGIRTHEPLRDEVLSLTPLTRLGDPRVDSTRQFYGLRIFKSQVGSNV